MHRKALDQNTDGYQQVRVDYQEVADLDTYRVSSPLFTLTLPENNALGAEPGVAQAVSEAYSFIIAPPPPANTRSTSRRRPPGNPRAQSASSSKRPK